MIKKLLFSKIVFCILHFFISLCQSNLLFAQDSLSVTLSDSVNIVNTLDKKVNTNKIFIVGNTFISNIDQFSNSDVVLIKDKVAPKKNIKTNPIVAYNNEIKKKIKKIVLAQKRNLTYLSNNRSTTFLTTSEEQPSFSLTRQVVNDFKNTNKHIVFLVLVPIFIDQKIFSFQELTNYQILFDIDFVRPPPNRHLV